MSFTKKAATAAGSLAALSGASTDAGVMHVASPFSINMSVTSNTTVDWDVDGVNGIEARLIFNSFGVNEGSIRLLTSTSNMQGFVRGNGASAGSAILNLNPGFVVGPTLATNYQFGISATDHRALLRTSGGAINVVASSFPGFTSGDRGFAGFRFDQGGTTLYGWAAFTLDAIAPGSFTVSEWAYEDSGAAITVGDTGTAAVPEPSSLALMAMGAAGLAAWRRRRKQRTTQEQTS